MGNGSGQPRRGADLEVRRANADDMPIIANDLDPEYQRELQALVGEHHVQALFLCHALSDESSVLCHDGVPIAVWGVQRIDDEDTPYAEVWMISSRGVRKVPVSFTKIVREQLKELSDRFGVLVGYVDARNTNHIRWIERTGFTLTTLFPATDDCPAPFYEFQGSFSDNG